MNAIAAFFNDLANFIEPIVCGVIRFERTPCDKARANNRKDGGIKQYLIAVIKWTINEDVPV